MKILVPSNGSSLIKSLSLSLGLAVATAPSLNASNWTGGNGNWSSDSNPGWNGTGVPNAVGAVAQKMDSTAATITQDVSGGVTVGTLNFGGNSGVLLTTALGATAFTLNQDGAGAGFATISNTNVSGSSGNRFNITGTNMILADDLLITNTSGSSSGQGSLSVGTLLGTGNVTINNVSNNLTSGQITIGGNAASFVGSVSIQRGAVTYLSGGAFGNSANLVTLGSPGNSTTVINRNTAGTTVPNNITVAATVGTNIVGSDATNANNFTFSGTILLNGNLTASSVKSGGNDVRFTNAISGVGSFSTAGTGEVQLGNGSSSLTNTYSGDTVLTGTSSLVLSDNTELSFVIGASGVNNSIMGTGQILALDGNFNFDLSGAAAMGSWTIVDVANLTETFSSSFTVNGGFTQASDVWTRVVGPSTFTFTESTGVLTAVPEPSSQAMLIGGLAMVALCRIRSRNSRRTAV